MRIALDMMGGDYAPLEAVQGLQLYLTENSNTAGVICVGDENILRPMLTGISPDAVTFVHAPDIIGFHEHPAKSLKEKTESSISKGYQLVAAGKADAFISAGNTGAMLVGAMFFLKPIDGIQRPTISCTIPKKGGGTGLLLDVGLNVDCKPQHLEQFAVLGSLYAENILGIKNPSAGLLNVGEEETKGNAITQAAYPLLKENPKINFIGNVEGRDIFIGGADVTICDGFTGNVILKLGESVYDLAHNRGINDQFFNRFHYESYGGTPVLGISKPIIIGHGISSRRAFANMLLLAQKMIETNICSTIREAFQS